MLRLLLAMLLSLFGICCAFSQTITLGPVQGPVCLDTELAFPVTLAGTFNANNTFTVQMRQQYGTTITSFPATLKDGRVRFSISGVSPDLYYTYQFRVISSNPVAESEWLTSLYLSVPASVTMSPLSTDPVNPYESFLVQLTGRGSGTMTVMLNDTLTLLASSNYSGSVTIDTQKQLPTNQPALYRVTSVSNVCGVGKGSGSARVTLNELSLRVVGLSSKRACQGDAFILTPSISGGSFGPANQFRVRFTNTTAPFRSVEVAATAQNGQVRAVVPTLGTFGSGQAAPYTVQLLSTEPAAVSPPLPVFVYDAPSVRFASGSPTIDVGNFINYQLAFSGIPPFEAIASDGSRIREDTYFTSSGSAQPTQSASYSIVALTTGCATAPTSLPAERLLVTVRPSIHIDSVSSGGSYCEGSRQWVAISSNVDLPASTQYQVQLFNTKNSFYGPVLTATRVGNRLEYLVKTDTPASYQHYMQLRVTATSGGTSYTTEMGDGLYVMRTPRVTVTQPKPLTVTFNSYVIVPVSFEGGGPYRLTLSDGTQLTENFTGAALAGSFKMAFQTGGQYSIRSVSNACFTGTGVGSFSIVVQGAPAVGIYISDPPSTQETGWRCASDSVRLTFKPIGTFAADNVFTVQVQQDGQEWRSLPIVVTPGKPIALAQLPGYRNYRIASSNPVAYSDSRYISVANPPTIGFNSYNWNTQPVQGSRQSLTATIQQGILPFTVVYTRNNETITRQVGGETMNESVEINTPTTFTIKSIRDACGVGSIATGTSRSASLTATPVALRLVVLLSHLEGGTILPCAGNQVLIPFLVQGMTTANTRYSLQIAQPDSAFRTVGTPISQSPFLLTIPSSATNGLKIRIVASNPDVVGESSTLSIFQAPIARLSAADGSDRLLVDANPGNLRVSLSGSANSTQLVFSDGFSVNTSESSYNRLVSPSRRQTYSLRSAANTCGYGTVAGQVTVSVKPTLTVQAPTRACTASPLSITYTSRGEFGSANLFRFSIQSGDGKTVVLLDSSQVASDVRSLRLPGLPPGRFILAVTTTDPAVTATAGFNVVAPVRLNLTGSTVINADQTTQLAIRASYQDQPTSVPTDPVSFTLSNGVTQTVDWSNVLTNSLLVPVTPRQTTTYTITDVRSVCGVGQAVGQAVITVNPLTSAQLVTTDPLNQLQRIFCAGDSVRVGYTVTGTLPTGSRLTVQLSDSTGLNFIDLPTTLGQTGLLAAALPTNTPAATSYRLRVSANNPTVSAGAYGSPLRLASPPTAQFALASIVYQPGSTVRIPVKLGGVGPWVYQIQTDLTTQSRFTAMANDTLTVQPISPVLTFQIKRISNDWCSRGLILEPAQLRLELVTATEPLLALVKVAPNPTTDYIQIQWQNGTQQSTVIRLSTLSGTTLLIRPGQRTSDSLSLGHLPAGIYLLQLTQGAQQQTVRVVKH